MTESQVFPLIDGIEAVAFDLDGTLIDTAPDLAAAANMMLMILGGRPVPEQQVPALIGGGVDEFVAGVLRKSGAMRAPDAALTRSAAVLFRDLYEQQRFQRSRVYAGAMEVLQLLKSAAIPACCITNKESRFAVPLLKAAALHPLFAVTLCADRPDHRKPSPTLLLAACAQLGIEPDKLLYVGDAPSDIAAARAAGCRVAVVDYGYNHHVTLAEAQPDAIVGNLTEIVAAGLGQQRRAGPSVAMQ
jgi:phosphoglycolate phosphatase